MKKRAKHGILKTYSTLALAEESKKDPKTGIKTPSDTNVEEARTWCRVNQK